MLVAHHGIAVEILTGAGERHIVRVKRNSGHVVGDNVIVAGGVMSRRERRTELRRRDARGRIHLVAANLDLLGVVVAPGAPLRFADRAIVAARGAGLKPFLVVNKYDLEETSELLACIRSIYAESLPLFPVSSLMRTGLEPLREFFSSGERGAFIGAPGVGKSSLLNALCPDIGLKVGALSDYKGLGRHTTTVATLHIMPGGGELADTPGFRDFGLVNISVDDLAEYFPGFENQESAACRFSDCRHRSEPGCAVIRLLEEGSITAERYATYMEILGEAETGEAEARSRGWKN